MDKCPSYWKTITVNEKTFCASNFKRQSQSEAKLLCEAQNAKLPMPKSQAEFLAFRSLVPDKHGGIWTGFELRSYSEGFRPGTKITEQTLYKGKDSRTAQVLCVREVVGRPATNNIFQTKSINACQTCAQGFDEKKIDGEDQCFRKRFNKLYSILHKYCL